MGPRQSAQDLQRAALGHRCLEGRGTQAFLEHRAGSHSLCPVSLLHRADPGPELTATQLGGLTLGGSGEGLPPFPAPQGSVPWLL